jgi:hypothetical protein
MISTITNHMTMKIINTVTEASMTRRSITYVIIVTKEIGITRAAEWRLDNLKE